MEPEELVVSILGWKSESASDREKILRSVSCQTPRVYGGQSSLPVIFCALFSTLSEAATQADIPFRVSVAVSTETSPSQLPQDESIGKLALKQNDFQVEEKHVEEAIENVVKGVDAPAAVRGADAPVAEGGVDTPAAVRGADAPVAEGGVDTPAAVRGADAPAAAVRGVDASAAAVRGADAPAAVRDADAPAAADDDDDDGDDEEERHPDSDHHDVDEDVDTDELMDDKFLHFSSNDVEKEPENSDFSSDNDDAFWATMKKLSKSEKRIKRKRKWGYKFLYHSAEYSKHELKVPKDLFMGTNNEDTKLLKDPSSGRGSKPVRTNSKKNKRSDERSVINDDWITDSEVDDDSVDINEAFRLEWKKNRLPHNTKEKKFVCEVCGKLYSRYHLVREHVVRDHKDHEVAKKYPYSCEHCKRLYSGERQLEYHRQQQSGPCEVCGLMFKCSGLFWVHRRNHDAVCTICDKTFQSRSSLVMHNKVKHKERTVSCPLCPRMFAYKFIMKSHIDKAHHPSVKSMHNCTSCDFWAKTEGALRIHQRRVHRIEPPLYTCGICNAKFSTKNSHKVHMTRHLNPEEFACSVCSEIFKTASALRSHRRSAHPQLARRGTKRKVRRQQPEEEQAQGFHCSLCSMSLTTEEELRQHILHSHAKDSSNITTMKQEVGSIQLTEMDEQAASIMQINVNDENIEVHTDVGELTEQLNVGSGINYSATRSALLMPASVVPSDVSMVDIDGVQYHVLRGSQE